MNDDSLTNSKVIGESLFVPINHESAVFATTQWSVVLAAGNRDFEKAAAALQRLCSAYWYPIYAFIRRRGSDVHGAEDLTQAFWFIHKVCT